MNVVRIRPHHILCALSFIGEGYDSRFVRNMQEVVSALGSRETVVRISTSCDDICSACPHMKDGVCRDESSVVEKDRSTISHLGLQGCEEASAEYLMQQARMMLGELKDIREVCGECDWADLCNRQMRKV